ncbi:MAG: sodium-dependent transporter [Chitinivibrionales bacterium]
MEKRAQWGSNLGFLLAAIGSAVGLGNIWRFPYVAYKNGGGAFLIPYITALLTAGIPILMLEFAIGHEKQASAPKAFRQIGRKWEWVGWWPVFFVMFGIVMYYIVVLSWCVNYIFFSFTKAWGKDPDGFFNNTFLKISDGPWDLQGINFYVLIGVLVIWGVNWLITHSGVEKGIEKAVKMMMPVLFFITLGIVIWGVLLKGSGEGIRVYTTPDWEKVMNLDVWIAAYGQIFFSLSLGFGIMIAYSSYLPRDANIFKNAMIVGFSNSIYEIFVGFGVFGILGYMAVGQGTGLDEVVTRSIGLAFVVFPEAISNMPYGSFFGVIFFSLLSIAGISSAISIIEAFTSAVIDKFEWPRKKVITVLCVLGFLGSSLFATNAGSYWLDIVDHFLNHYGLITVGILEAFVIGWIYKTSLLKNHIVSQLGLSGHKHRIFNYIVLQLWMYCIKFVTPVALGIAIVNSLISEFAEVYGGYSISAVLIIGVGWLLLTHVIAFGVSGIPWKSPVEEDS